MPIESRSSNREIAGKKRHSESPRRLMLVLRTNIYPFVKRISAEGEKNLEKIPSGVPVIFAMTHATNDIELQVGTLVVGKKFDLALTNHSSQHSFEHPMAFLGVKAAGIKNFYPISHIRGTPSDKGQPIFNPHDFVDMLDAFEQGKAIVMAAHNPEYGGALPDKPGIGVVTLASLAASRFGKNALIVPVAIDFDKDIPLAITNTLGATAKNLKSLRRANATVTIGEPMYIAPVNIERYIEIGSKPTNELTDNDRQELNNIRTALREQGGKIMDQLAEIMPLKRRGKWGNSPDAIIT